jgi:cyclophilin family peptidyl-prolyl cis-trans isomerase/HEAT repeat protein
MVPVKEHVSTLRFSVSLCKTLVSAASVTSAAVASVLSVGSAAQTAVAPTVTRLAVMQAEDRRAPTARDLAVIRAGAHGGDPGTARVAIRALGRLERPSLVADILPFLKHSLPELRSEAANAVAQSLAGSKTDVPSATQTATAIDALIARSKVEAEGSVRSAIFEALGRCAAAAQIDRVEATLVEGAAGEPTIDGRLGIVSGFEALIRRHHREHATGTAAVEALRQMAAISPPATRRSDPSRDVRVRRVALEALIAAEAVDAATLDLARRDPDAQVRRLAMRAAAAAAGFEALAAGLTDSSPMVRIEAIRGMRARGPALGCPPALNAVADRDTQVALVALDQLSICGDSPEAVSLLVRAVESLADAGARNWQRAAHALLALASASPDRAAEALARASSSPIWQLRMYAARAAALRKDAALLQKLAADDDDNVREAAIDGLAKVAGHDADATYAAQLTRSGNQVLRAAAAALVGSPNPDAAVPALQRAHERLIAEGRDNSHDARVSIETALASVRAPAVTHTDATNGGPRSAPASPSAAAPAGGGAANGRLTRGDVSDLNAEDVRRLAAARARVTMRAIGAFDLLLFTPEAPATVLRFARLAEAGYYNGLTFHRVVPNFVIQGGSPGANEYVGDARFMRDEVGQWPHVRGAVGISTRGRDTGDAQIFIDLVDNPRLNHDYTVFAQVLNGFDVIDQILEGDVIEKIEIVTR